LAEEMGSIIKVRGIERLSQDDLRALERAASIIDIHPDWLASVMSFESGLNPAARNALSNATGLIQFMPSTANRLGTTISELSRMSFQEQLPYVIKYFGEKAGLRSLEDTYLKVFYPLAIGKTADWIVAKEGEAVYTQNQGFDTSHRGFITKADITSTIRGVYNRGKAAGEILVTPL
jgi:hypothetical protein